jgi:ureidoacrylate peracid hydrolase
MEYKIRPTLIIIDMQNCFVSKEGSFDKLGYKINKYQKIVPTVKYIYKKAKSLRIPVFFSQAIRERSGIDMIEKVHKILPPKRLERIERIPLSVRGTWDAEIIDELKPDSKDLIVEKRRDSIFQDTEFEMWLKSLKINTLIFTGIDTSICVESSLRDAFNKGFDVILLSDATASLNSKFHKTTLSEVKENFGLVFESKELFRRLKKKKGNEFMLKIK